MMLNPQAISFGGFLFFNPPSLSSPRRFRVHFIFHCRAAISYLDPYVLLIALHS